MPTWKLPKNLLQLIESDPDGMWDSSAWEPILLTVMTDTLYHGRAIPLHWQIEFEAGDALSEAANEKVEALGLEPDGYGWAELIKTEFAKFHPNAVNELEFSDTELSTCVIWMESENTCKLLIEMVWNLLHNS